MITLLASYRRSSTGLGERHFHALATRCYTTGMDRKLRIAASTLFGLLTVVMCVLWVRSYITFDRLVMPPKDNALMLISFQGQLTRVMLDYCEVYLPFWDRGPAIKDPAYTFDKWEGPEMFGFGYQRGLEYCKMPTGLPGYHPTDLTGRSYGGRASGVIFPHWSLAGLAFGLTIMSLFAAIPAWRFSLRTLFIATTLLAVALGTGVWLAS